MKRYYYFLLLFISVFSYAQSNYTEQQVEKSKDPQVIANFIKYNPSHPRTPEFKRKLLAVINNDNTPSQRAIVAKPSVKPVNSGKQSVASNNSNASNNKKTVDLLNHIFNSDPSSTTAYVQIVNKSRCNLIVKISGKKYYNLNVPANNQNFILVEKGNYNLTTSVCDAKYSSVKNIRKDIVVTLNPPK